MVPSDGSSSLGHKKKPLSKTPKRQHVLWNRSSVVSLKFAQQMNCHPERVRMILEITHSNEHIYIDFGCVGTVQDNCANLSQFGCYSSLGHEEPGTSPLLPKVNLRPYAMPVPAVHTANDK
jgi:hypothetical protein